MRLGVPTNRVKTRLFSENVPYASVAGVQTSAASRSKIDRHFLRFLMSKLTQFVSVRNAKDEEIAKQSESCSSGSMSSDVLPFECFLDSELVNNLEEREKFFKDILPSDRLIASVKSVEVSGLIVTLLCTSTRLKRVLEHLELNVFVPSFNVQLPMELFKTKQILIATVLDVNPNAGLLTLSIANDEESANSCLIDETQLPEYYRLWSEQDSDEALVYDQLLKQTRSFQNPASVGVLAGKLGLADRLNDRAPQSFLNCVKKMNFNATEFAGSLRKRQSHKLSMKSVLRGVELMRSGSNQEAMQHLNKALDIEADNPDALVARGACRANVQNFEMALQDFESALSIQPQHDNARKYMIETSMAHAIVLSKNMNESAAAKKLTSPTAPEKVVRAAEKEQRKAKRKIVRCLRRVLDLDGKHEEARRRLKRLGVDVETMRSSPSPRKPKRSREHSPSTRVFGQPIVDVESSPSSADDDDTSIKSLSPKTGKKRAKPSDSPDAVHAKSVRSGDTSLDKDVLQRRLQQFYRSYTRGTAELAATDAMRPEFVQKVADYAKEHQQKHARRERSPDVSPERLNDLISNKPHRSRSNSSSDLEIVAEKSSCRASNHKRPPEKQQRRGSNTKTSPSPSARSRDHRDNRTGPTSDRDRDRRRTSDHTTGRRHSYQGYYNGRGNGRRGYYARRQSGDRDRRQDEPKMNEEDLKIEKGLRNMEDFIAQLKTNK